MRIAVIPARKGSKRLPNKNLKRLGNRSLVERTCDQAIASNIFDLIVVSTDSATIAHEVRGLGMRVIDRPATLAEDSVKIESVIQHVLENTPCESYVLLQPTSPLRTADDIRDSVELHVASDADTVVSLTVVPQEFRPEKLLIMQSDSSTISSAPISISDNCPVLYSRNGPAVLVSSPDVFETYGLYGPRTVGYVMPRTRSIDINYQEDLDMATALLRLSEHPSG